jgi:hypothetical protein
MILKLRTIGVTFLIGFGAIAACSGTSGGDAPGRTGDAGAGGASDGGTGNGTAGNVAHGGTFVARAGSTGNSGGDAGMSVSAGAGQGGEGEACPGCDSGFCLADGTCVDCLANKDRCPSGQYCTDAHECVSGCKADGSSCASGQCGADHNCKNCISDDECANDLVCGAGKCSATCSVAQESQTAGCQNGLTCCSKHCTDLAVDSDHCGACGTACDDGQFCGLTACAGGASGPCVTCHDTTLANICSVGRVVVILDTSKNDSDGNRVPGRAIGAAIKAQCVPAPTLTEAEQDSVEALNLTTGRPVSSSNELLVVAGGPYYQNLEGYVEQERIAPIYFNGTDDSSEFRKNSDKSLVIGLPLAADHDSHDFFLIQFMRDSASGSLVLNAQGFWLSGTVAATYQVTNAVLPNLATFNKAWYVYEWTDADNDKAPDAGEIVLTASGL